MKYRTYLVERIPWFKNKDLYGIDHDYTEDWNECVKIHGLTLKGFYTTDSELKDNEVYINAHDGELIKAIKILAEFELGGGELTPNVYPKE